MLLQNSLFRCGGAAILLSNRWTDAPCARFKLLHLVRTQLMTDQAYGQGPAPPGRRAWPQHPCLAATLRLIRIFSRFFSLYTFDT